MATPPSRQPTLRSQLVERRWNRVRTASARSNEGRDVRQARSSATATANERRRLHWARWLLCGVGVLFLGILANAGAAWMREPGAADLRSGEQLFTHKWEPQDPLSAGGDGLGPVFNARSCVECHFQGGVGGAGGLQHNVAAFEVLPTVGHPDPSGGVIHAFALRPDWKESPSTVSKLFPIVPQGVTVTAVCTAPLRRDYNPVVQHSINTPTLFGAGAIDRISAMAIRGLHTQRLVATVKHDLELDFKMTSAGRLRILPDGRIGKFGWKAQFATLEEFVANACAVEVGLTTPTRKQHQPQKHREDPDARPDLDQRQFTQLVAYVSRLPAPQVVLPIDEAQRSLATRGQSLFTSVGCADCHTPDLGGARGVYSDFCLHDITDPHSGGYSETPEVPVPDDYPLQPEWKTAPLWGAAQTAPYLHDGSAATLIDAIQAHGGQARHVRDRFRKLTKDDQRALVRFLESLVVSPQQ